MESSSASKLACLRVKLVDKSSTTDGDKELRVLLTRNGSNDVTSSTIELPNELIAKTSEGDTFLLAGVYQVFLGDDPSSFFAIKRTCFECFERLLMAWGYLPELLTYRNRPECQARIETLWKARKPVGANQRASVKELFQTTLRGFWCEKVSAEIEEAWLVYVADGAAVFPLARESKYKQALPCGLATHNSACLSPKHHQ